jgi:hypothetical protein
MSLPPHINDRIKDSFIDNGDGTTAQQVAIVSGGGGGGGGSGTEYTEDAALPANPIGGVIIGRRRDTPSAEVSADGDAIALNATNLGELYVQDIAANTTLSAVNAKLPDLDSSKISVIPSMNSSGHLSAQTNATGTDWTAYGSQALKQLTISNQSGTAIEFRQGGSGVGFQVPTGSFYTFFGISNASSLEIRRVDQSNTQVTITARWES